ncbi:hypothetical protein DQ04_14031000, partial [Trypanosoma grayi]|uniref:hypothetical protein n=1 Tax=Trypanosoma grayi TaxID=71804 RepID=UPI0004F4500B
MHKLQRAVCAPFVLCVVSSLCMPVCTFVRLTRLCLLRSVVYISCHALVVAASLSLSPSVGVCFPRLSLCWYGLQQMSGCGRRHRAKHLTRQFLDADGWTGPAP